LPFLVLLSDVPAVNPAAAFKHADQAFVRGYLEDSEREAEQEYRRFLYSNPSWARKFQLLEATAMAFRGLNQDMLVTLSDDRIPWIKADDKIQRLALEATAFAYLNRFSEADRTLQNADSLCSKERSIQCGAVLRAHGLYLLEHGELESAEKSLSASLDFARLNQDKMLEATALLNLGTVASRRERHDEADRYYRASAEKAGELGASDVRQNALGNEGWEQYSLGNSEKALAIFQEAERSAISVGDMKSQILWLSTAALAYADQGQPVSAERFDLQAIALARSINKKQEIIDASMDLAQVYIGLGKLDEADRYIMEARAMAQATGSQVDVLTCDLHAGEAAVLRHDWPRADQLLHSVVASPGSLTVMKWQAQRALGNLYEAQGQNSFAEDSYRAALALVEGARADLKQEVSQLTFLSNASLIYDDYIHLLVAEGRTDEALEAADWSRARSLQQDVGVISSAKAVGPPHFKAMEIARKANATLLFYWLGEKQSYLWAISGKETHFITLPAKSEIAPVIARYQRALLGLKDPARDGDKDGRALYDMLVAPAAGVLAAGRPVVLFVDGPMGGLNFDTLVAPSPTPHYWIEDATLLSAPSIRIFASAMNRVSAPGRNAGKLLLLGDSVSPGAEFPVLPMAALEMEKVKHDFPASSETVFAGEQATPSAYLASKPENFAYIHFVTHGTASRTDPLDSAVILSRAGANDPADDSYKLYAREILRHPIDARLVTISACNSTGTKSVTGEGLVGLSWAFLRAGAHNAIGALWEVSDASTPELMDHLYTGLGRGEPPATALREAKLSLLHSGGRFSRPFYWAPFQLYAGR
jgi:CHAT domain-containing protein